MKFSESQEPIKQALEHLTEKDEDVHPVVIVEKTDDTDLFVQFAIKNGAIYFDVPNFRITLEPVTPEMGAERAVAELAALGIQPDEEITIREEEDEASGWENPIRRPRPA
jgi:hypothetical protein